MLIRDIEPEIVQGLRLRARRNQRSLEAEIRVILQGVSIEPVTAAFDDIQCVRAMFVGCSFTESAVLLREDRER